MLKKVPTKNKKANCAKNVTQLGDLSQDVATTRAEPTLRTNTESGTGKEA